MSTVHLIIKGKVQGVFYRQSTLETANQLGINGFVQNEPDGNVYMEVEGEEAQLNKLIEWCRTGPSRAVPVARVAGRSVRAGRVARRRDQHEAGDHIDR